jgi:hypothetical protein
MSRSCLPLGQQHPIPLTPPVPELAQVVLAQAAELGRQRDFRADSNHLGLAYTAHHILQCASREDFILPGGIDCGAANHFVEAVFEGATASSGNERESERCGETCQS